MEDPTQLCDADGRMSTEDPPRWDRHHAPSVTDDRLDASASSEDDSFELDFIKSSHPPKTQQPSADLAVESKRELVLAVDAALARFATSGSTALAGDQLLLRHSHGTATEDARSALSRWDGLAESERERLANQLARKLVASRNSTAPSPAPHEFHVDWGLVGLVLGSLGVVLALCYWTFWSNPEQGPLVRANALQPGGVSISSHVAPHSSSAVCEATLARIYRGGLISMADADGWVVELSLLGAVDPGPLETSTELRKFIAPKGKGAWRYVWTEEPQLAVSSQSAPPLRVRPLSISTQGRTYHGLTLTFEGSFVESYFDEISREKFYHLAHNLAAATQAKHVALYARCAHDEVHTLGSWFLGEHSQGVAASLLYFMGMYAAPRHISPVHYRDPQAQAPEHARAFSSILQATTHLDRKALATLVGSEGGMAVSATDKVVVTFPFRDGSRATRVSRTMARVTGLSDEGLDQGRTSP